MNGCLFGEGELEAEIIDRGELGARTLRFISRDAQHVREQIERLGHIPLPPYIDRADEPADRERYQTVFAKRAGAIAAPTAGLHFTPEILEQIRQRGVEICELTLDVGLGTFQPIHAENSGRPRDARGVVRDTRRDNRGAHSHCACKPGRPILAIGTTVVRALEDAALRASESGSARTACSRERRKRDCSFSRDFAFES